MLGQSRALARMSVDEAGILVVARGGMLVVGGDLKGVVRER